MPYLQEFRIYILVIHYKQQIRIFMSKIQVNGKEQILETASISVLELIKLNKVLNADMVSVQLNGEFVDREEYNSTQLKANDEVDFLYFMGGGAN